MWGYTPVRTTGVLVTLSGVITLSVIITLSVVTTVSVQHWTNLPWLAAKRANAAMRLRIIMAYAGVVRC